MDSASLPFIALASMFGGTLFGMYLRTLLNEQHLSADSRDVMKLGTNMIATMAALVLSLLIASAKGTFDTMANGLTQTGAKIILLDRTLAQYGQETKEIREMLRRDVAATIKRIWPAERAGMAVEQPYQSKSSIENLAETLRQLSPQNDDQRWLRSRAIQVSSEINETRLLLFQHVGQRSFPMPLLVLLISWLTIIFANFGLITPRNTTVIIVLLVCALAAASSLFLILELDQPFGGVIKLTSHSLLSALEQIGR